MATLSNVELIRRMFEAKRVPLHLLGRVSAFREYHRAAFASVRDTVNPGVTLHEFDVYFDFVLKQVERLESLWDE